MFDKKRNARSLFEHLRGGVALGAAALALAVGVTAAPAPAQAAVSSDKQQVIAIDSSSLNGNAIRGKGDTVTSSSPAMDNACYFYSAGVISNGGFPTSGKITAPTSNITYQLGWTGTNAYDGNDCIRLVNGDSTKTMTLSTVGAYEQIYVLATAGGPGQNHYADFEVTLTYTDGTTDVTTYKLYDWYDTTKVANVEQIASFKRMWNGNSSTSSSSTIGSTTGAPILHSAAITADKTKLLKSITFNSKGMDGSGSNSGIYSTIYAVTGVVDNSAPATPTATPATGVGTTTFTANWNSVSGATSYVIDVATDSSFSNIVSSYNNKNVGSTTSTAVSVPNVGSQTYYYRVRAVNSNGQSLSSNVITVDTVASLKVSKQVDAASGLTAPTSYYNAAGTQVDGFAFKFTVPTSSANGYAAQVFNADGTTAGDSFRVTNGYIQTITAGQYIQLYGLSAGEQVSVQELTEDTDRAPKGFSLTSRTVAGQEVSGTGNTVSTTVVSSTGTVSSQNTVVFTNTYKPESYTIANGSFAAKKILTGRDWLASDEFTIRIKAPAGTPMPTELEVTTDADGYSVITKNITAENKDQLLTCGAITYTEPGTYYYTLNEAIPTERAQGMTYSAAEYRADITISEDGKGGLYVSNVKFVQYLDDSGNAMEKDVAATDGVYVGIFTNSWNQTSANVTAEVTKNFTNHDTGAALAAGQFTFAMTALGGYDTANAKFSPTTIDTTISAPMPDSAVGGSITVKNLGNGVATFPAITYTFADNAGKAYVYKLTEVNDGTVGMTYDSSVYYMVVRVAQAGQGIMVTRDYYDASGATLADRPDFVNAYKVEPVSADPDQTIKVSKTLTGRDWNEGEAYTFTVTPDAATQTAIDNGVVTDVARTITVAAPESGSKATATAAYADEASTAMTFTKSGTYTFTVAESYVEDTKTSGVSYDSHKGTVTYTVTDTGVAAENGNSQLAVSVEYKDTDFTNTYSATGVFSGVSVTNTLAGRALESDKFSFEVKGLSYNGEKPAIAEPASIKVPNGNSGEKTVITDEDNNTLLSANTDESMLGKTQAFVIRETSPAADGYCFDTTNTGDALVLIEVKAKDNMPADLYTVTRVYKGAAVSELLASGADLNDEAVAKLSDCLVQTVDSSATGDKPTVDFTNTYAATLDYGAQSDLQIHVALAYEENSAVTDRTHAFEVIVKPVATDTVSAEEAGKHLTTAPAGKVITTGQMKPSAAADAEKNAYTFNLSAFKFGAFTQDDAGKTFAFDTSEVVETIDVDGYTFDTNTYRTWIAVTDNGNGTLSATTTVKRMNADGSEGEQVGEPYTCTTNTKGVATTSVSFSNTYKAYPPADYTPQVVKQAVGKAATASETFSFKMVAADDATRALMDAGMLTDSTTGKAIASTDTLTASTSGAIAENSSQVVSFDKLVFNEVGTYKFNITEDIPNDTAGWDYDSHTYELTVTVRDSGGKLTAEASSSSAQGGNRFSNTYSTSTTLGKEGGFDVEKVLNGRTLRAGEFTFKAEGTDDASKAKVNLLQGAKDGAVTVTNEGLNDEGRSVTGLLEGLSFSNSDRNKTFTFKVSEVAGSVAATTYDSNYYTIAITPYETSTGSGVLKLKVVVAKYNAAGEQQGDATTYDSNNGTVNPVVVSFENTYKATGTWPLGDDDALRANVTLTGRDLKADELHFNVYAVKTDGSSMMKVSEGTNVAAKDGEAAQIVLPQLSLNLGEGMGRQTIDLLQAVKANYAQKILHDDGSATYALTFRMVEDTAQMPAGVRSVSGDPSRTVRLVVTDDGKGTLSAQVEYRTGDTTGSVEFYDVYEKVKTVSVAGSADDIDGQVLSAGQTYTYSIKWVNNASDVDSSGNYTSKAATITVTDVLPANVEFVFADNGGVCTDGTVTWTLADQAARAYGTVSVTVRAKTDYAAGDGDKLVTSNQATVAVEGGSTYTSNTVSNQVARKISSVGEGQKVLVGDEVTYTIEYANAGTEAATVYVTDVLPTGLEYVSATDGGSCENGAVSWVVANVAAGASGKVSVTARVGVAAAGTTVSNTATVRVGDSGTEFQTTTATNPVKSGSLTISKAVTTDSGIKIPDGTFAFKLTLMDKDGNEVSRDQQFSFTGSQVGSAYNGVTIYLKAGQHVTISGLPEGYQYKVEEATAPAGFKAQQAEFAGTIAADTESTAAYTNVYNPDDIQLDGEKALKVAKTLNGRAWQQNDKFTFTFVAGNDAAKEFMPQGAGATVVLDYYNREGSFGSIEYDHTGEYVYYVTETASSTDDAANLTSSQAKYQVVVTVDSEYDAEGKPTGKFTIKSVTTQLKDDLGADVADAKGVENGTCSFSNAYATAQSLTVSNKVEADEGFSPSADKEFTYTVELKYANGNPVNGEFGGLTFVDGKASFTLKGGESKVLQGLPNNATYTVTQTEEGAYTTKANGEQTLSVGGTAGEDAQAAAFVNTYAPKATDPVSIQSRMTISGRTFTSEDVLNSKFQLKLIDTTDSAEKVAQTKDVSLTVGGSTGSVSFDAISYSKPGTYTYKIVDVNGSDTINGVTHDGAVHTATVTVTDDHNGKLNAEFVYDADATEQPTYVCTYTAANATDSVSGSVVVTPTTGNSYAIEANDFAFHIKNTEKPDACETDYNQTLTYNVAPTGEDATKAGFTFDDLNFPVAGTYKFVVERDEATSPAGITSDGESFEIVYDVTDNGQGQLVVSKTINKVTKDGTAEVDAIVFGDTYNPASVGTTFSGSVSMNNVDPGTTRGVTDDEFTFVVEATNDDAKGYLPEPAETTNSGTAFNFGTITYDHPGTYTYKVSEKAGSDATLTYDKTVYDVTVTVTDEGGKLKAEVSGIPETGMSFTNDYTPAAVTGDDVIGSIALSGRDADKGEFTIKVIDPEGNETEVPVDPNTDFGITEPEFDRVGTYEYTISQVPGTRGGVTYDNSVYTVTYKVTEDPDTHELVVTHEIRKTDGTAESEVVESVEFENAYAPVGKPSADLSANVKLDGDSLGGGEFTVIVIDKDGNVVAEAKNNADGTVDLSGIELDGPGTYTFTVKQQLSDKDGVTTDSKEYAVTIVVTDDLNGGYIVDVTYDGLAEGEVPVFNNVFTPASADDGNGDGRKDKIPNAGDATFAVEGVVLAGVVLSGLGIAIRKRKQ
jgi:pilin isopeptide linkage protein/uncharacterized repeat protein (TIGR01451 family)